MHIDKAAPSTRPEEQAALGVIRLRCVELTTQEASGSSIGNPADTPYAMHCPLGCTHIKAPVCCVTSHLAAPSHLPLDTTLVGKVGLPAAGYRVIKGRHHKHDVLVVRPFTPVHCKDTEDSLGDHEDRLCADVSLNTLRTIWRLCGNVFTIK